MIAREQIYTALLAALGASASFTTISRRVVLPENTSPAQMPVLCLRERAEKASGGERGLTVWELEVDVFVYAYADQSATAIPVAALNPLLDSIAAAIAPGQPGAFQTLGGVCDHCWIGGEVKKFPDLGQVAAAVVPVRIRAA